ncbi:MAG: helix-turn-helix transcriptional regulator [Lachnospiraceae bacterium]|nr:helix-turn-helix transcriptional regulator [Lachnospiraceae bacterium]
MYVGITEKHIIKPVAVFGLYMFLYSSLLTMMNRDSTGYITPGQQQIMYFTDMFLVALGFVVHAVLADNRIRITGICLAAACIIDAPAAFLMELFPSETVFIFCAPVSAFCLGMVGGSVYLGVSESLARSRRRGLAVALGSIAGLLLQFFLQLWTDTGIILPVLMAAGFPALIPAGRILSDKCQEEESAPAVTDKIGRGYLIRLTVIVTCIVVLTSFYDGYLERIMTNAAFSGSLNTYSMPRFILIPVYLLMGILADLTGVTGLSLCTLSINFLSVLNLLILRDGHPVTVLTLYYLQAASCIAYYNQMFIRVAPQTERRALWSSMGRITDGLVAAMLGFVMFSSLSTVTVAALSVVLFTVILTLMAQNGYLSPVGMRGGSAGPAGRNENFRGEENEPLPDPPAGGTETGPAEGEDQPAERKTLTEEERMEAFAGRYGLSKREGEVLSRVLSSEETNAAIAAELNISERMVYKHMRNIYDKTGKTTRAGLARLYYQEQQ